MKSSVLSPHPIHTSERYLSLDVLRGLTIALMIVVNTPGSWSHIYAPFRHAAWHGFTPTDFVFPSFLFVVGNAMSFSMKKLSSEPSGVVLRKLFKRAFMIFLIGVLLNFFPFFYRNAEGQLLLKNITEVRIMGVLQRIALCYLFAGLILHFFRTKATYFIGGGILLSYWGIMYIFGDAADPFSLEGNAALKFDRWVFADKNLYGGFGLPFDPEGLLSTLPAIVNVLAGFWAGLYIQKEKNLSKKTIVLSIAGALCIGLGLLWDPFFPINKPIWTSSYVAFSTGWSLVVLAGLMVLIELFKVTKWTYFFEVFGKNPLFIYILSGVLIQLLIIIRVNGSSLNGWIYQNLFLSWSSGENASLAFAVSYTLVLWLIGLWMMKKKIFIKV
jgi:predicted acyltransferase